MKIPHHNTLFLLLSSALLTACGGGGGGGGNQAAPATVQPAPVVVNAPVAAAPAQGNAPQQAAPVVAGNGPVVNVPAVAPAQGNVPQQAAPVVAGNGPVVNVPVVAPAQGEAPQQVAPVVAGNGPVVNVPVAAPAPVVPAVVKAPLVPAQPDPVRGDAPAAPVEAQYQGMLREVGLHNGIHDSIFNALSPDRMFTAKIAGTDIVIDVVPADKLSPNDSRVITKQKILTLRDASNQLAGYYGYLVTSTHRENVLDSDDHDQSDLSLVYAVNTDEQHRPSVAATYQGHVFYHQFEIPNEAALTLEYADNKITGTLIGIPNTQSAGLHYDIQNDGDNTVSESGAFSANLHNADNVQRNAIGGNIIGNFYGKEAEMAVGEVILTDTKDADVRGVFGAKKK